MRLAVIQFPGSGDDDGLYDALRADGDDTVEPVWHESNDLNGFDAVIVPGGYTYGDYLRPGALAALSPVVAALRSYAEDGGIVIGFGNGFQILCEAHLLPGVLLLNESGRFRCETVSVRVEQGGTALTSACTSGDVLHIPVAHKSGRYYANESDLTRLEENGQVLFRYVTADGRLRDEANLNGSIHHIAGVCNVEKNVLGFIGRPERNVEPPMGNGDGNKIFESLRNYISRFAQGGKAR